MMQIDIFLRFQYGAVIFHLIEFPNPAFSHMFISPISLEWFQISQEDQS